MQDVTSQVTVFHTTYCQLTGSQIPLTMGRILAWEQWIVRGKFTVSHLREVIRYIQQGVKLRKRHLGALKFNNLIENYDKFAEELAFLKMEQNAARRPAPKLNAGLATVLKDTGRPDNLESKPARSASKVIDKLMTVEAFSKALQEWREANP